MVHDSHVGQVSDSCMVLVTGAGVVVIGELYEVKPAVILNGEDLLLLVEHPLHASQVLLEINDLLAIPLPVAPQEYHY